MSRSRLVRLAVLVLLAAAIILPSCASPTEAVEPLALAQRVWGGVPDSPHESGIVLGGFEDGVLVVEYHYYPFDGDDSLPECERELKYLFEAVFSKCPEVAKVMVIIDLPFSDAYNNTTWEPCVLCTMTRATAAKVNWDNFDSGNLPRICDEWWDSR